MLMEIDEIVEESGIVQCAFCGKCSCGCPVGKRSRLRVRNLIHDIYMGKMCWIRRNSGSARHATPVLRDARKE